MTVYVLPPWEPTGMPAFDVTTHGIAALSPMRLGPVPLYDGHVSQTVENAWQYAKLYPEHATTAGEPSPEYWTWAQKGWADPRGVRYPMGKGSKPLCSLWDGEHLGYIQARGQIYMALYAHAVHKYARGWLKSLKGLHEKYGAIVLRDFDAYDHRKLGYSWQDVIDDPERKMGHGFVLAMMIEGAL